MWRERSSCQSQRVTSNSEDELKVGVTAAAAPGGLWAWLLTHCQGAQRAISRVKASPAPSLAGNAPGLGWVSLSSCWSCLCLSWAGKVCWGCASTGDTGPCFCWPLLSPSAFQQGVERWKCHFPALGERVPSPLTPLQIEIMIMRVS